MRLKPLILLAGAAGAIAAVAKRRPQAVQTVANAAPEPVKQAASSAAETVQRAVQNVTPGGDEGAQEHERLEPADRGRAPAAGRAGRTTQLRRPRGHRRARHHAA